MKRFTETDKWRDSWFRKLKPLAKIAFLYVVDNCDAAGVWDPDYELANFAIGENINWIEVSKELGERLVMLKCGKWHLTRFVEFQYGELVPECRPHAKVLQLLKGHGIPYKKGIQRVSIPTGRGQDNTGSGQDGEKTPPEPVVTAETIYEVYPRKEARQDALKAIGKAMERCPPARLLERTQAYAAAVAKWIPDDRKYVPHPATWFNGGRFDDDPTTWAREAPQPVTPPRPNIYVEMPGWREKAAALWPDIDYPSKWSELSVSARNALLQAK